MKKIILSISLLIILLLPQYSYALESGAALKSRLNALQTERIASRTALLQRESGNLKPRADSEIERRISALNKLLDILSNSKKLSSSDSANLASQVQSNIDGLNALKVKIDQESDVNAQRADVKSIISNYYIFAFFIDYIHLNAAFDRATTIVNNMTTLSIKLQTRISEAKNKGQDTTSLNALLVDMLNKLNDVKSLITSAESELSGLSASGYPNNKSTLLDARGKLQTVYNDLKAAYQDGNQIIHSLKIDADSSPSQTPTETPINSPTPTPV